MTWKDVSPDLVLNVIDECDGDSLLDIDGLEKLGVPRELLAQAVDFHVSEKKNPHSWLFRFDGDKSRDVPAMTAIADLDLARQIAKDLGVTWEGFFSSGREVRAIQEAVKNYYASSKV